MAKRPVEQSREEVQGQVGPSAPKPTRQFDLRKAERVAVALPLTYTFHLADEPLCNTTTTINLSGLGVQFAIPHMVSPQTPCQITLSLPNDPEPICCRGSVVWCRQIRGKGKEQCEVGVMFVFPDASNEAMLARYCHFIATHLLMRHLK